MVEDFLRDLARANANWRIAILRYFNPAGAHSSGMLGEAPRGRPNNLVPLLCKIAAGELADLAIYGGDWPTPDGTGIRDYLHVQDLAEGQCRCGVKYLAKAHGAITLNLGTGRGHSVMEVVKAFESRVRAPDHQVDRAAPAGRRRLLLRRSAACGEAAEMARDARSRRHLRRCVAVAEEWRKVLERDQIAGACFAPRAIWSR